MREQARMDGAEVIFRAVGKCSVTGAMADAEARGPDYRTALAHWYAVVSSLIEKVVVAKAAELARLTPAGRAAIERGDSAAIKTAAGEFLAEDLEPIMFGLLKQGRGAREIFELLTDEERWHEARLAASCGASEAYESRLARLIVELVD